MEIEDLCRRIYEIALPYAEKLPSPAAYIDVVLGSDFPYSEADLWKTFKKIKWDSPLTASELEFFHNPDPDFSHCAAVTGIIGFEDDHGKADICRIPEQEGKLL